LYLFAAILIALMFVMAALVCPAAITWMSFSITTGIEAILYFLYVKGNVDVKKITFGQGQFSAEFGEEKKDAKTFHG